MLSLNLSLRIPVPDDRASRPCHGTEARYAADPHWRDLVLFHEYFHGDTGRGVGASHQTGWTALVVRCLETVARARSTAIHVPQSVHQSTRAMAAT